MFIIIFDDGISIMLRSVFTISLLCSPNCTTEDLYWDYNLDNQIDFIDYAANCQDFEGAFQANGRYMLTDFQGSVMAVADESGEITADIEYDAWGMPYTVDDLEGLAVLFKGYYYDNETGNYYLRNRYYSPLERRFLTEDPHGINPDGNWNNPFNVLAQYTDGFGLMVYAKSDPVNNYDPWGLEKIKLADINWRSGKLPLILIWVEIKLKGEAYVEVFENVAKKDCPDRGWPKNIRLDWDVHFYSDWGTHAKRAGIDSYLGAVGTGFEAKVGAKYGISTTGNSLLSQIWNLSVDRGMYSFSNIEGQKYFNHFNKFGMRKRCVCVRPGFEINPSFEYGVHIVRVGTVLATWKAAIAAGATEIATAASALSGI